MAEPPPKGNHLVGNFQTPALPTGIFEVFVFSFAYSLVGIVVNMRTQRKDANSGSSQKSWDPYFQTCDCS